VSWRARALLREAWLNAWANGARSAVVIGIAAAAMGVLAFLELRQANDLRAFQRDYAAAGGYVAIVRGQERPIPAARCDAVQGWDGVVAAGAVRRAETVTFATAPGLLFQSAEVTPGLLAVWRPGYAAVPAPEGGSLVVGTTLADELGLEAGMYAAPLGAEPVVVAAVLDMGRRNPQVQRWALEVAPASGLAAECWVEFDRNSYAAGQASLGAWFAEGSQEPIVVPWRRSDEFTRDPAAEFAGRPQRFGWLAAGALIAAVFTLGAWFRRAELGLYLAVGTSRLQLLGLLAVEATLLFGLSAAVGVAWALAVQRALDHPVPWEEARLAARSAVSGGLLGLALAPWVAVLVARGNIAALLKDR
jgi:hypothetical protein